MHSSRCVPFATEMRVVQCTAQSRLPHISSRAATFTWFPVSGPPEERAVQLSAVPKKGTLFRFFQRPGTVREQPFASNLVNPANQRHYFIFNLFLIFN